ncbi:aminodeoxychorismate lyase [Frateuria sp.]|uniref:aminodeoxychorismate lyase n=1 Tax=Frateuria sp. TaxID=2211372 RepID=UPI0017B47F83|nr:aminodeoxychorismate lyase [Frateuria sp.]NUR21516.1 aminodeoxychorismate lyase [Frateuria sp.]
MMPRVLVDGQASDRVAALDRGLGYGDGLFETIRFAGAEAPLWARHMQRLDEGCRRLRLPMPDPAVLLAEARTASQGMDHAVVRITLTRGSGARGYAPPAQPRPTRIVAAFEPPPFDGPAQSGGIRVRLCALRLAPQPLLAGLKHLNRLEQVLARAEWDDPAIAEGLLCDTGGLAICATAANLFAVYAGKLTTPALDRCGVAGVARAEILAARPQAQVRPILLAELRQADELFLSSSVRGILPVRELDGHAFAVGPVTRALQAHWRALGF